MKIHFASQQILRSLVLAGLLIAGLASSNSVLAQFRLPNPNEQNTLEAPAHPKDERSALFGTWTSELSSEAGVLSARLLLSPEGTYRGSVAVSIARNGETIKEQEDSQGTWVAERGILKMMSPDNSTVDKFAYRFEGEHLILRELTEGGIELRMSKGDPANGTREPNHRQKPEPKANPVVGTWYSSGHSPNGRCSIETSLRSDGGYSVRFQIEGVNGVQQLAGEGRWMIQGNQLRFESTGGVEVVPFELREGVLILDYSRTNGFVAIFSKQPGRGEILMMTNPGPNSPGTVPESDGPFSPYNAIPYGPINQDSGKFGLQNNGPMTPYVPAPAGPSGDSYYPGGYGPNNFVPDSSPSRQY